MEGTEAETKEEHALLPCLLLNYLSGTYQDHLSVSGTTHSGLGPPTLIISQETTPTDLPI